MIFPLCTFLYNIRTKFNFLPLLPPTGQRWDAPSPTLPTNCRRLCLRRCSIRVETPSHTSPSFLGPTPTSYDVTLCNSTTRLCNTLHRVLVSTNQPPPPPFTLPLLRHPPLSFPLTHTIWPYYCYRTEMK